MGATGYFNFPTLEKHHQAVYRYMGAGCEDYFCVFVFLKRSNSPCKVSLISATKLSIYPTLLPLSAFYTVV